jgi:hypothetical protein
VAVVQRERVPRLPASVREDLPTVAGTDALLDRLLSLPGHAQQPNMLLAAVHDLALRGGAPVLAQRYDSRMSHGVGRVFVDVAPEAWDELVPILEVRLTQTNEIGRVALLAPAFAALALDNPATIVDVGTSAGLTPTVDRCLIDYGPVGRLVPPDSPVRVTCEVLHGEPPLGVASVGRSELAVIGKPPAVINQCRVVGVLVGVDAADHGDFGGCGCHAGARSSVRDDLTERASRPGGRQVCDGASSPSSYQVSSLGRHASGQG